MESVDRLQELILSVEYAQSNMTARSEQISFLHECVLALWNILDVERDTCTPGSNSHERPNRIVQLHRRRLAYQRTCGEDRFVASRPSTLTAPSGDETYFNPHKSSVFKILGRVVSAIEDLCTREWTHLFPASRVGERGETGAGPFSGDCGIEDCALILQQLQYIQEQGKEMAGQGDQLTAREGVVHQLGGKVATEQEDGKSDIEDCIRIIMERLSGYEDAINRLLSDLRDWKNEDWIKTLENNYQLLVEPRFVQMLFESGLQFKNQSSHGSLTEVEINNQRRLLKLSSQCFAGLPLPLQCTVFEWLWEQPRGDELFGGCEVMNVHHGLTRVFNRLVTGPSQYHIAEVAREICCSALHSVHLTLQKAVHEAVNNMDAGTLICKVLQSAPFLVKLEQSGRCCFMAELNSFVRALSERDLSPKEELNLFNFIRNLLQPHRSPCRPGLPFTFPPLVAPIQLAECCVWPFLTSRTRRGGTDVIQAHQHEAEAGRLPCDVPIHLVLKTLDAIFVASAGRQSFDSTAYFSTVLCLFQILDDCIAPLDGGREDAQRFTVQELSTDLLQKFVALVKESHSEEVSRCVVWLLQQTNDLQWTTKLRVNALFTDIDPVCQENIDRFVGDVCGSFVQSVIAESEEKRAPVPISLMWSITMKVFFQGCGISASVADLLLKRVPRDVLKRARHDFYKAVCIALHQTLPSCTNAEWLAILCVLDQLVSDGVLCVSYTANYIASLPMFDFIMYRRPLQLSQLLTAAVQLLSDSRTSGCLTPQMWQQSCRSYTHAAKEVSHIASSIYANSSTTGSGSGAAALLFVVGQLFCHSCELAGRVPPACAEQLFVWSLELLLRVEELMVHHGTDAVVGDWAKHEFETLSRMVESVPGLEQRSTLRHKLSALFSAS